MSVKFIVINPTTTPTILYLCWIYFLKWMLVSAKVSYQPIAALAILCERCLQKRWAQSIGTGPQPIEMHV